MTCIAAIVKDGQVFIGADSAGVTGSRLDVRADEKVFINGQFVIGSVGSFRHGQLLQYAFKPPDRDLAKPIEQYMVTDFVDAARRCLKDGGCLKRETEIETGADFIVGTEGRIFIVYNDWQIAMWPIEYAALGCGAPLALGALHVLAKDKRMNPKSKLLAALKISERFDCNVRGPFVIRSLKGRGK